MVPRVYPSYVQRSGTLQALTIHLGPDTAVGTRAHLICSLALSTLPHVWLRIGTKTWKCHCAYRFPERLTLACELPATLRSFYLPPAEAVTRVMRSRALVARTSLMLLINIACLRQTAITRYLV